MPLIKSGSREAVSRNISEMVHAGHPQNQAVAAAMRNAREYGAHMASGGFTPPMGERFAARQQFREGFLHSSVPGQGNSLSGANIVSKMFKSGPYGSAPTALRGTGVKMPHLNLTPKAPKIARGGQAGHGKPIPIIAAGGEIVLSPEQIIKRFGSLEKGHKALDHWVNTTRKKHIKTLRGLKPPKKD